MTVSGPSTTAEDPDDDEDDDVETDDIHIFWRWGAAILGGASLTFGTLGVFATHVEAGPVALLVVGLVFALIAMSGHLPWRIKIGDSEIELRRERQKRRKTEALAVDLAASVDPAAQPQAIEIVDRSALADSNLARAMKGALGYEQTIVAMIKQIISDRIPGEYIEPRELIQSADLTKTPAQQPTLFDGALLRSPARDRKALVEIKATTRDIDASWINVLHDRFVRGVNQYGAQMLLLVTSEALGRGAGMRIHNFTDMVWVQVGGVYDAERLAAGIDRVIGPLYGEYKPA